MSVWLLAIAGAVLVCALHLALSMRRAEADGRAGDTREREYFRLALTGIDADEGNGRIGPAEARAARKELAVQLLALEKSRRAPHADRLSKAWPLALGSVATFGVAVVLYAALGSPDLPAQPLAERPEVQAQALELDEVVAQIEARLEIAPDDVRGWQALASSYMLLERYADAERAWRNVVELDDDSNAARVGLAEAMIMHSDGVADEEAMALLRAAAADDPGEVRARFYIANELTRRADYPAAEAAWKEMIALAQGDDGWLEIAQAGRDFAASGGAALAGADVAGMVEGLAARLARDGGPVEDWTALVRAHLVLGDRGAAQAAYDEAATAYPTTFERGELDTVALSGGLRVRGDEP